MRATILATADGHRGCVHRKQETTSSQQHFMGRFSHKSRIKASRWLLLLVANCKNSTALALELKT